ncbi:MAG: type II toxin-antitoxin system PemK/MazF family toxin [Gammaproteobacteria bacterium]|nr:type II toxin-antitoxin system PemK/MazF family toxin [Gammaproteobacteria bacterium]
MQQFDIVICALSGDYGKPRPALIVQNSAFNAAHASIVICPITSHVEKEIVFRPTLLPDAQNGLEKISQIMIDKITTVKKEKLGQKLGVIALHKQEEVLNALRLWLNIS